MRFRLVGEQQTIRIDLSKPSRVDGALELASKMHGESSFIFKFARPLQAADPAIR